MIYSDIISVIQKSKNMKRLLVFIVACIATLSVATALSVNLKADNDPFLDPSKMYQTLWYCTEWRLQLACTTLDTNTRCRIYYCLIEE